MGILNRLNTLIRSNVNDLITGSSEPDRALDRSIRDMEGSLVDARQASAQARASEKRLLREWDQVRDEALDWEDKAMEALRLGDEELARDCLLMKRKHDAKADKVREDLEHQRGYLGDLGKSLDALETKLEAVRARRRTVSTLVVPGRDPHRPPHRGEAAPRATGVTLPFDSDRPSRQALAFDDDIRRENPEAAFGAEAPFEHFDASRTGSKRILPAPRRARISWRIRWRTRWQTGSPGVFAISRASVTCASSKSARLRNRRHRSPDRSPTCAGASSTSSKDEAPRGPFGAGPRLVPAGV